LKQFDQPRVMVFSADSGGLAAWREPLVGAAGVVRRSLSAKGSGWDHREAGWWIALIKTFGLLLGSGRRRRISGWRSSGQTLGRTS
jgi:hypothetical protein